MQDVNEAYQKLLKLKERTAERLEDAKKKDHYFLMATLEGKLAGLELAIDILDGKY